jgi:DNA polymerase-3 subunit alpha
MANQREKFRLGAIQRGINGTIATTIFDKMEKFAAYGFNKSHATAYGYLGYATAYLKANHTAEWLAALMTSDRDDLSKVARHMHEARTFSIPILPPDINESGQTFMAAFKGIRFAMGGIKGIGEGVVETILKEKEARGNYLSLYDFVARIDTNKVGKKVIENLIEAGCFDFTQWSRQALLLSVNPLYEEVSKDQKETSQGILSLFSLIEEEKGARFKTPPPVTEPVSRQLILKREHELLGIYLNGHPLDEYRSQLQRLSCVPLHEIDPLPSGSTCRIAFIIEGVVVKIASKSQRKFSILTIGDGVQQFELPIWPDLYEQKAALIIENQLIYAIVQKEVQEGQTKLQCRWLTDLNLVDETVVKACDTAYDQAKLQAKKMEMRPRVEKQTIPAKKGFAQLKIQLNPAQVRLSHILLLKELFRTYSGVIPVEITFAGKGQTLSIDKSWGVDYSLDLESKLKALKPIQEYSWEV